MSTLCYMHLVSHQNSKAPREIEVCRCSRAAVHALWTTLVAITLPSSNPSACYRVAHVVVVHKACTSYTIATLTTWNRHGSIPHRGEPTPTPSMIIIKVSVTPLQIRDYRISAHDQHIMTRPVVISSSSSNIFKLKPWCLSRFDTARFKEIKFTLAVTLRISIIYVHRTIIFPFFLDCVFIKRTRSSMLWLNASRNAGYEPTVTGTTVFSEDSEPAGYPSWSGKNKCYRTLAKTAIF